MKSIISGAFIATAIVAMLTLNVRAGSVKPSHTIAVTDTGKMKMEKMKKMKKDSMKMSKMKMKKMKKDTSGKM